jgi:hypothetical protein
MTKPFRILWSHKILKCYQIFVIILAYSNSHLHFKRGHYESIKYSDWKEKVKRKI